MQEKELNKEKLEVKKLELEIKALNKPWYAKPAYLGILIALISIFSAQFTGLIDIKKEALNLEKLKLEREVYKFEERKKSLSSEIEFLEKKITDQESLMLAQKNKLDSFQLITTELRKKNQSAIKELGILQTQKEHLTIQIKNKEELLKTSNKKLYESQKENQKLKEALFALNSNLFKKPKEDDIKVSKTDKFLKTTIKIDYLRLGFIPDPSYLDSVVNEISKYYKIDKAKSKIRITGTADGLKISRPIKYSGEYGNFIEDKYFSERERTNKVLRMKEGDYIKNNEQLAFLRAFGMKKAFIDDFKNEPNIDLIIDVHEKLGPEFRNINIEIISPLIK